MSAVKNKKPVKKKKKSNNKLFKYGLIAVLTLIIGWFLVPDSLKRRVAIYAYRITYPYLHEEKATNTDCRDILFQYNPVYGIDVSAHQGSIEWKEVKQIDGKPVSFVYIKATEGAKLKDRRYSYNLSEARRYGLKVGSYHYFKSNRTANQQFANFASTASISKQDLIPVVDVEEITGGTTPEIFHRNLSQFLLLLEKHYGKKPIIYSQNNFYRKHLADSYSDYQVMLARYHTNRPNACDDWLIWQYSEAGRIAGISRSVDLNILNSVDFELTDIEL
jgi:lysozyme